MELKMLGKAILLLSAPLWAETQQAPIHTSSMCSDTEAINAKACYGAKGNLHIATCSISVGSTKLTCSQPQFTVDAVGMSVYVAEAGDANSSSSLQATIRAYISPTEATLSTAASSSRTNAHTLWGSDDTAALQAAYTAAVSEGRALYIPAGSYLHHGLNWTGNNLKLYGDSYGGTFLFALAVTNPGKTTQDAQSTGVDISASGYNEVDHIAFFGGWFGMADLAPQVNVLGGRIGSNGNGLAIAHIFDGDFFTTFGPYDVVLFGYEQSSFLNPHFESDAGGANHGMLYLSAVNTPGIKSPYRTLVPHTSMTALSVTGDRSVFGGNGPQVVLDQGPGIDIYSISIRDTYINLSSGAFLSDVGTGAIRDVVLDKDNIETGNCLSCQAIEMIGPAWNWQVTSVELYANSGPLTDSAYVFKGGFLDGYARVDATGTGGNPEFSASSCAGSILQLGQEQPSTNCTDYALASSVSGVLGATVGNTHWTSGTGAPTSACSVGSIYTNSGATSANTALYLCYPANTWTPVKVR